MNTKVAIVEDNPGFRTLIQQMLQDTPGYVSVCSCGTAEEGIRAIPKAQPDVVLMDIQLPGISGIDCVARLRQNMPDLPVIMLTVNNDAERIFSALKAGAKGYLLKRTTPQRLIPAIQEVLSGGSPMSGEIARKVVEFFSQQSKVAETSGELSRRETEVLELLAQGYADKEIAAHLSVGYETIRTHLKNIYYKLHVSSRTAAVSKYLSTTR
jgi:DNA-binding NarL/FixJ family response regulator